MTRNIKHYPYLKKSVSLCDVHIDEIICMENAVRFVFNSGFFLVEDNKSIQTKTGYVEFGECNTDEFICHIVKRIPTQSGAQLFGTPVSIFELSRLLSEGHKKIELFLELYDSEFMYWRGTLLPHKQCGLSDNVVIESSGCYPITYCWEDSN